MLILYCMAAWLNFAKLYLNKPQAFSNNLHRTDQSYVIWL